MAVIFDLEKIFKHANLPLNECVLIAGDESAEIRFGSDWVAYGVYTPFRGLDRNNFIESLLCADNPFLTSCVEYGEFCYLKINRKTGLIEFNKDFTASKNLFYSFESDKLFVSTSVYEVLSNLKNREFSVSACAEYLNFEYISTPKTLFKNIFSIGHSERVIHSAGGAEVERTVYDLLSEVKEAYTSDWSKSLRKNIIQAHDRRLTEKNGIYLSGGVDSTVMGITLKRDLGVKDLLGVSFKTLGADNDESGYAIQAAKELKINHEIIVVDPNKNIDLFDLVDKSNYPYFGGIILNTVGATLNARGYYGYNLFAGQDSRVHTPPYNFIDNFVLNKIYTHPMLRKTLAFVSTGIDQLKFSGKPGKAFDRMKYADRPDLYLSRYFQHLHRNTSMEMTHDNIKIRNDVIDSFAKKLKSTTSKLSVVNALFDESWNRQYWCDMDYMIRCTQSFGFQASMPFYDREFNLASASLPLSLKMKLTTGRAGYGGKRKSVNKFCLREAYKGELSDELVYRDKAVSIVNHLYLNGSMSPYVEEYFPKSRIDEIGLARALGVSNSMRSAIENSGRWGISDYDDVVEIQSLLNLELIARKYSIDKIGI